MQIYIEKTNRANISHDLFFIYTTSIYSMSLRKPLLLQLSLTHLEGVATADVARVEA